MRSVEQRLERLERQMRPMPVESAEAAWARDLESLRRESAEAGRRLQDALDAERLRRQEETERLARRVETIARHRIETDADPTRPATAGPPAGFEQWENQLLARLRERESRLIDQLREELDRMRHWVRDGFPPRRHQSELHQALEQLAASARQIADQLPNRS